MKPFLLSYWAIPKGLTNQTDAFYTDNKATINPSISTADLRLIVWRACWGNPANTIKVHNASVANTDLERGHVADIMAVFDHWDDGAWQKYLNALTELFHIYETEKTTKKYEIHHNGLLIPIISP